MIKEFSIMNFKCFEKLEAKPWKRVNLIAGKNNIGKTALLEAIWMHEGIHNANLAFNVESFRGMTNFNNKDFLNDLFTKFKSEKEILLKAEYQDNKVLTLKVRQEERGGAEPISIESAEGEGPSSVSPKIIFEGTDDGSEICKSEIFLGVDPRDGRVRPFSKGTGQSIRPSAIFVSTGFSKEQKNKINADRFSAQVEIKRKPKIVESLKIIDDRLQDLELVKKGNQYFIHGEVGYNRMISMSLMGEGMERYLTFVLAILSAENGTVLIDEIENGFHHAVHRKIWSNLAKLAREYKVQIIATTHSHECIEAAHESFKQDKEYDFILHRLDRVGERIEDVTYDRDTLEASLKSDMEIR